MATSNTTFTYFNLFEDVRAKNMSVKHYSPDLKNIVAECLAQLWSIDFNTVILEKSNENSEFWSCVEDFARNIPKFWCQFGGNKRAMLKRHHIFFYKERPIGDLIQNQPENMNIGDLCSSRWIFEKLKKLKN